MATRKTVATAIAAATGVLTLYAAALGQTGSTAKTLSQSDFDLCNREAQVATGGSAAPSGTLGAAGATGGTGALSGGSTLSSGSTSSSSPLSSGSTSTAGDPQLRGIASSGAADPAFQEAYRDCMRRRGF
jgi:hypothetical protein